MHLTIAYVTSRKNPRVEWFLDSLKREGGFCSDVSIVIISSWMTVGNEVEKSFGVKCDIPIRKGISVNSFAIISSPKPCVWQGPNRLTKEDYFAASNARNTALCYAPDGYVVFCDDLSVIMPGWLNAVREGMAQNKIICGAYRKVKQLKVENGVAVSWEEYPGGMDTRTKYAKSNPWPCDGGWLYGCSVAMPVEALLTINGWPEFCDGAGGEDCLCGIVLQNAGFQFIYDQRMLTLESEEAHHEEQALKKDDWHFDGGVPIRGGNGKDDKSHAALNIALQSKMFPNYCNFRELRQRILNGGEFPIVQSPEHDWYTKIPLRDL